MQAKTDAAWKAVERGVKAVVVCSGFQRNSILQAANGETIGTLFVANPELEISLSSLTKRVRDASIVLRSMSNRERSHILNQVADELLRSQDKILEANRIDLENATRENLDEVLKARLRLTSSKINTLADGIRQIANMDPIGKVIRRTKIADGLELTQITAPLGVLLVIFESRPGLEINR